MWARSFTAKAEEQKIESQEDNAELKKVFDDEIAFLEMMFGSDAKNYHCWSHKIWFVERYGLWAEPRHLEFAENLMNNDVRNNSVWSFRYFVIMRAADKVKD